MALQPAIDVPRVSDFLFRSSIVRRTALIDEAVGQLADEVTPLRLTAVADSLLARHNEASRYLPVKKLASIEDETTALSVEAAIDDLFRDDTDVKGDVL